MGLIIKSSNAFQFIVCVILLQNSNAVILQVDNSHISELNTFRINITEQKTKLPYTIQVNVSVSEVGRFLVYSDSTCNFLNLSISKTLTLKLIVKLWNLQENIDIHKLCNCWICKYTPLTLSVTVSMTTVAIQCNNANTQSFDIPPEPKLETSCSSTDNYILIFKNNKNNNERLNCIHKILFNDDEIFRETQGTWKCVRICHKNLCNGGKCLEKYNGKTLCDCTYTFRNGEFCNSSMSASRDQFTKKNLHDENIKNWKFSFITKSKDIVQLENGNTSFSIKVETHKLYLEIKMKGENTSIKQFTLSEKYEQNKESILILKIEDKDLLFEFLNVNGIHNNMTVSGISLGGLTSLNYSDGMNIGYSSIDGEFMEITNNIRVSANEHTPNRNFASKLQINQQVGDGTMLGIVISVLLFVLVILITVAIKCSTRQTARRPRRFKRKSSIVGF